MINANLTSDPKILTEIYTYLREEGGMIPETEEEAQAMMMSYIDAFIQEYGVDEAFSEGLLIPLKMNA
jgi:hypothetical protein